MLNSETTVARGSVLRSLNPTFVRDRRLRTSYGIAQQEEFDPKRHDEKLKEQDEHEAKDVVNDCIYWVCKSVCVIQNLRSSLPILTIKGQLLAQNQQLKELDLTWTIDADYDFKCGNSREEFFCELYMSDEKDPKDHQTLRQMREQNLRKL